MYKVYDRKTDELQEGVSKEELINIINQAYKGDVFANTMMERVEKQLENRSQVNVRNYIVLK